MKTKLVHLLALLTVSFFQLTAQSEIQNLALSGTASQSSTNPGVAHEAFRAIDGITAGIGAADSIAETDDLPNSYWEVELTQNSIIEQITLFARFDCDICLAALSEYTLQVLDENDEVVWSQFFATAPTGSNFSRTVTVSLVGKKVRVMKDGRLYIAEAQVFGEALESQSNTNLALTGIASQSSTNPGLAHEAFRAIDNNLTTIGDGDSIAETQDLPNSYWQVELAKNSNISHISLYPRTDCASCLAGLSQYTLEVLDENDAVIWSQFFETHPLSVRTVSVNVIGKTVRVNRDGRINIAEAQVFGNVIEEPTTNLALSGVASQSSTAPGVAHEAFRAIDGITAGIGAADSIAETEDLPNSYWRVELEQNSDITQISLYARFDCDICLAALSNYTLEVLDENGLVVWSQFYATAPSAPNFVRTVDLNVSGKTVRVSKDGRLNIAEAQVFGIPSTVTSTNLALTGIASQSSTSFNGLASKAIDGNTDGKYGNNSVTHTDSNTPNNAWWQVELAEKSDISEIQIWNRTDSCCSNRLSNYNVDVLDEFGNTVYTQFFSAAPPIDGNETINLNVAAKTVRIRINGILSLAEVRVIGSPVILESALFSNISSSLKQVDSNFFENQNNDTKIVVYPNPVSEKLIIELPGLSMEKETNVSLFDITGRQHISKTLPTDHGAVLELILEGLTDGFYFLQVQSGANSADVEKIYVSSSR